MKAFLSFFLNLFISPSTQADPPTIDFDRLTFPIFERVNTTSDLSNALAGGGGIHAYSETF